MLQRIPNLQQPSKLLRPVANKRVAFQTTSEDARMLRSADERREETFGQVFAGVASANGAAAVVDYDGSVVEVGHGGRGRGGALSRWEVGGEVVARLEIGLGLGLDFGSPVLID